MWLSTKRKRNDESKPSSILMREASSTVCQVVRPGSDWQSSFPLDWKRTRRGGKDTISYVNHNACRHRAHIRPFSRGFGENSPGATATTINRNENDDDDDDSSNKFDGRAIFCLHDDDPNWVQGYFIPRGSNKPWGMLAIQEPVEDCCACSSGGYRRLSLTVYHCGDGHRRQPSDDKSMARNESSTKTSYKIDGVDWTAGDMMTLYHPLHVDMEAERLFTGVRALPVLKKYFQGLINRLEKECDVEEGSSILDWLPNVAIVTGPMSLTLPRH